MAETSLKPCPFCGKAMQYRAALFVSDGCTDAVIHAEPTDCGLVQFDIGATDGGVSTIAAWNRRATDPAVAELVEALRTVQLARINGLFDAAIEHQIAGDVDGVFAEVDAALAKHAAKP